MLKKRKRPKADGGDEDTSSKRKVGDRWTPAVAAHGWTPICDYFLTNYHRLGITHGGAMLVVHLISFKWDADAPFPSLSRLAKYMGITPTSVRTHLRRLEQKGYLYRQMRTGTTNRFHLTGLFDAMEKLMDEDREEAAKAKDELAVA